MKQGDRYVTLITKLCHSLAVIPNDCLTDIETHSSFFLLDTEEVVLKMTVPNEKELQFK